MPQTEFTGRGQPRRTGGRAEPGASPGTSQFGPVLTVAVAAQRAMLPPYEVLHFPGHAVDGESFLRSIERAARRAGVLGEGVPLKRAHLPWGLLRMGGLVVPMWRELAEMRYLWDVPHRLSGERLSALIGALPSTPLEQALGETLELAEPGAVTVRAEVAFARETPLGTATGGELSDSDVRRVELVVNGRVAAAHADYGHGGPTWSSFFYEKGGGSLPDLGVYNLTSLTGLLGPAKSVVAMVNIVTPTRMIDRKGQIKVTEEDNAMVLLDHGNGVISHVQSGFNYFNPHGHEGAKETRHTIQIIGSKGVMGLVGYDWEPLGVDLATESVFGAIWSRPGIDLKTRTLVTVVSDVSTGRQEELAIHLRMALRQGWKEDELDEVILHLLGYVGAPLTRDAMLVASRVFAEMRGSQAARS